MTNQIPARPYIYVEGFEKSVAEKLISSVWNWMTRKGKPGTTMIELVKKDLENVIADASEFDGYRLAKALEEDCGWDVDESLVGLLTQVGVYVRTSHWDTVAAWVEWNGIRLTYDTGDRLVVKRKFDGSHGKEVEVEVVVDKLDARLAQYMVKATYEGRHYCWNVPCEEVVRKYEEPTVAPS